MVKKVPGKKRIGYTTVEVFQILVKARSESKPLHRWIPWLAALTGARIGELTQLWANQIRLEDGLCVIAIRPSEDGATIKTVSSNREVPVHSSLIDEGFWDFVQSRTDKPLFYEKRFIDPNRVHPAVTLITRQGEWIRKIGLDHTNKSPNHAFRHWFKSTAVSVGIADSMADAIQGHVSGGEAGKYRHFNLKDMYDAICKVPSPP